MEKTGMMGNAALYPFMKQLHMAAYDALELDWQYDYYPCESTEDFVSQLKAAKREGSEIVGLNLCAPFKADGNRHAVGRSQDTQTLGAAGLLTFNGGKSRAYAGIYADNTDGRSILAALREAGATPESARIVICGSGSMAMAALLALANVEALAVTLLSREPEVAGKAAKALLSKLGQVRFNNKASQAMVSGNRSDIVNISRMTDNLRLLMSRTKLEVQGYDRAAEVLAESDILINATPLGTTEGDLSPVPDSALHANLLVLDLSCLATDSALFKDALAAGANVADSLEILVEQSARGIELWTNALGLNYIAPREAMRQALLDDNN
jgi:shikimate dehydrogenase